MEPNTIQLVAGAIATTIFVGSNLPMLWKALTTRNLSSYSLAQIGLANAGNIVNWLYIAGLPFGPVWLLHGFNTAVALVMLVCYLRFEKNMSATLHPSQSTAQGEMSHA